MKNAINVTFADKNYLLSKARNMSTDNGLPIELEFAGGAELLVKNKEKLHKINLPKKSDKSQWTLKCVSEWIKDNLLTERPDLFLVNNNVRPGILVLVNDTDWELLGQQDYIVQENDKITFISTLHGG